MSPLLDAQGNVAAKCKPPSHEVIPGMGGCICGALQAVYLPTAEIVDLKAMIVGYRLHKAAAAEAAREATDDSIGPI